MKRMKPKTPEDLAKREQGKDKYTLYLDNELMHYLKIRANKAGTSVSKIVNEAIASYVSTIKNKKD
jgi:predicted HicB family RNase H-like nuclease